MRAILSKVVTGSMIAGAALLVSACGGTTETTNTVVTDVNTTEIDGTMTDNMTAVDGAMGNDTLITNDVTVNTTTTTTNAM